MRLLARHFIDERVGDCAELLVGQRSSDRPLRFENVWRKRVLDRGDERFVRREIGGNDLLFHPRAKTRRAAEQARRVA